MPSISFTESPRLAMNNTFLPRRFKYNVFGVLERSGLAVRPTNQIAKALQSPLLLQQRFIFWKDDDDTISRIIRRLDVTQCNYERKVYESGSIALCRVSLINHNSALCS